MTFWQRLTGKRISRAGPEASIVDASLESERLPSVYSLNVNYDVPFNEMIERGAYQYVSAYTKIDLRSVSSLQTGTVRLQVQLMPFRGISIKDALNELDTTKYRPATLHELLAFGEQYPDVQMRFSIFAPGSPIETDPGYYSATGERAATIVSVPRLAFGGLGRLVDTQPITHDMGGYQWMLAAVAI